MGEELMEIKMTEEEEGEKYFHAIHLLLTTLDNRSHGSPVFSFIFSHYLYILLVLGFTGCVESQDGTKVGGAGPFEAILTDSSALFSANTAPTFLRE